MTDLGKTIEPKSDQLNSDSLIPGNITIKITKVSLATEPEQPIAINYEGDNGKPYKPCKSMRRLLVQVWGRDGSKYVGRSMTLYRDEKVKFGGMDVGGIRISHVSDIDSPITLVLTASKASKKPYTVNPLKVSATKPPISKEIMDAGNQHANLGVEEYTKWVASLSDEQKESIGKQQHLEWTKIAKSVVTTTTEQPAI